MRTRKHKIIPNAGSLGSEVAFFGAAEAAALVPGRGTQRLVPAFRPGELHQIEELLLGRARRGRDVVIELPGVGLGDVVFGDAHHDHTDLAAELLVTSSTSPGLTSFCALAFSPLTSTCRL